MGEAGADHPGVPALSCQFFSNGMWITQEPPCRYSNNWFYIWNYRWSFTIDSAALEPSSVFRRNHVADSNVDFLDYFADHVADVFGLFCQNHVADVFLMTIENMEIIQENFYYS